MPLTIEQEIAALTVSTTSLTTSVLAAIADSGIRGVGIASILRTAGTGAAGTTDTYTITFTDATANTFTLVNGADGAKGDTGSQGVKGDTGDTGSQGFTGNGIASVLRTSGTGLAGVTDTYTITFTDLTTSTFSVVNGTNGSDVDHVTRTSGAGIAGTTDVYTMYADTAGLLSLGTFSVRNGADGSGTGDMSKSIYDISGNGIVDNAEKVNGLTVLTAVPINALFTDTVYTKPLSEQISYISGLQLALDSKLDDAQVLTDVPLGALFTDTITQVNNTLASSSITAALSAAQGKLLKDSQTKLELAVGTATNVRYDKILAALDIIEMVYTNGDLTTVRYSGDNNTSIYKRDVLAYSLGNLVTIKHFFNAVTLLSHSAITTLTYDASDNLIATAYLEV